MDLNFTEADQAFRQEVIEFLNAELPAEISRRVHADLQVSKEDTEFWHAVLHKRGWLTYNLAQILRRCRLEPRPTIHL